MTDRSFQRRLAAVLAADVAGYTRLMEQDSDGTVAAWRDAREEIIKPRVAEFAGKIVKLTGDGFLVEFPTVQDAVRCAIAMQEGLASSRLDFRMGVNLGDIIDDGEDIHGEGVNVAARIEALAAPGGVSISGMVYESIRNRIEANYRDLGHYEVKHVSHPVRVYAIRKPESVEAQAEPEVGAEAPAKRSDNRPSIAVLPFENMSDDPEQEYFSDGITEDIITDLSKISDLFVIARNSSFTYKGRSMKVPEVCRELGVGHVLEGSVRKAGNRVRVTAQLIEGQEGGHLWAERYDRDLSDVFAVQDELTREIVAALRVQLTTDESARIGVLQTDNMEAYDLVLRATEYHHRYTPEATAIGQKLTEQALEIAPEYARAHAQMARAYAVGVAMGWAADPAKSLDLASEHANKAVALEPNLAPGRHALAYVSLWRKQLDKAMTEIELALKLEPNSAVTHSLRSMIKSFAGDPEEGVHSARIALEHDPLQPRDLSSLGFAQYEAGLFDAALATNQKGAILQSDFWPCFAYLAATQVELGQIEAARQSVTHLIRSNPNISANLLRAVMPYRDPSKCDHFVAALVRAGLPE